MKTAQRVPAYSPPAFPHCYHLKLPWYLWPNEETTIGTLPLTKFQSFWISPVSPFVSSFCIRIQSKTPDCIMSSCLLSFFWAVTVSVFPCFLCPSQLGSTGQTFCRMSLSLGWSEVCCFCYFFPHDCTEVTNFWKDYYRGEVVS